MNYDSRLKESVVWYGKNHKSKIINQEINRI